MEIMSNGGRYIEKLPHLIYTELPENETLTMSLAANVDIEVPISGPLLDADQTRSYFVRRFDRVAWDKQPVEDRQGAKIFSICAPIQLPAGFTL